MDIGTLTGRSANGSAVTITQGKQQPGTTYGDDAVRCVYLTNGAALVGFTLTGGATRTTGNWQWDQSGGGVVGESTDAVVSNCVCSGNAAYNSGGGAESCLLVDCTLTANSAGYGGGADSSSLKNCIVYYNSALSGPNYGNTTLNYCCTDPLPGGPGNFTNAPLFVDRAGGNFHLQTNSPCINSGNNAYVTTATDFEAQPRIVFETVGNGAYEFQRARARTFSPNGSSDTACPPMARPISPTRMATD